MLKLLLFSFFLGFVVGQNFYASVYGSNNCSAAYFAAYSEGTVVSGCYTVTGSMFSSMYVSASMSLNIYNGTNCTGTPLVTISATACASLMPIIGFPFSVKLVAGLPSGTYYQTASFVPNATTMCTGAFSPNPVVPLPTTYKYVPMGMCLVSLGGSGVAQYSQVNSSYVLQQTGSTSCASSQLVPLGCFNQSNVTYQYSNVFTQAQITTAMMTTGMASSSGGMTGSPSTSFGITLIPSFFLALFFFLCSLLKF